MYKIKILFLLATPALLHAQPGNSSHGKRPAASQEETPASDSQNQEIVWGGFFTDHRTSLILAIDKLESSLGYPPEKRTRELNGEPMPDRETIAAMRLSLANQRLSGQEQDRLYYENKLIAPSSSIHPAARNDEKLKLAEMLYEGQGGDQDLSRARQLFVEILNAPAGDMDERVRRDARLKLITMLREGQGGEQDLTTTRRLIQEIIDIHRYPIAERPQYHEMMILDMKFKLAKMLLEGEGGRQDLPRARNLFQEVIAAERLYVDREVRNQAQTHLDDVIGREQARARIESKGQPLSTKRSRLL